MTQVVPLTAMLLVIAAIVSLTRAEELVFPGERWIETQPELQGIDSRGLAEAVGGLAASAGRNGTERTVIVRRGRVVWSGSEADTPQRVWSIAKAFTSTAHGLLIEDGKCSMETLAKDYNPLLAEHYPQVTLRHLATMTSGIDGTGGFYDCGPQGRCDANALTKPLSPFFPPGDKFLYWDEATQHYGAALTAIAEEPLPDLLERRVLQPIGVRTFDWQTDLTGEVVNWTGGVVISANDLARLGLLFLRGGQWQGEQIVDADWVDQATRVQVPTSVPNAFPNSNRVGAGVYGYHWWSNGLLPDGRRHWPDLPCGAYGRSGYNNNRLIVVPEWEVVVVRLGLDQRDDLLTTEELNRFFKQLGESLVDLP